MASLNVWSGTGRATRDAELKHVGADGIPLMTFSLAVDITVKRDGKWDSEAMFVKVDYFGGRRAEVIHEWVTKGTRVAVTGPIKLDEWESRDGEKRTTLVCRAKEVEVIDTKAEREARQESQDGKDEWGNVRAPTPAGPLDDDIPF